MMLAFNDLKMIDGALRNAAVNIPERVPKFMIHCHFPGQSKADLRSLSNEFGWTFLALPKNFGVAGNWSLVWQMLGLDSDSALFGMDPDARPDRPGFITAIDTAFKFEPTAAYISLNQPGLMEARPDMTIQTAGNVRLGHSKELYSWSVGAFHGRFVEQIWPLKQPRAHYGWIEHWAAAEMAKLGQTYYTLIDYTDHHQICQAGPLAEWKKAQVAGITKENYGEWCRARGVEVDPM